ncbi:twin-arginine translocase subunit TatC, partial [bacterium]|nr:twin-arginine translocase subunit TatC [bacterium]
ALGMYKSEKSRIVPFVIISSLFFLSGAAFCYYQVFHWGFRFFIGFTSDSIVPMITLQEYLKFVTRLIFVFGIIFEMPVASAFLAAIGVLSASMLRKNRQYAVIAIFTLAALLTPPDVVTQLLLAGPMLLLYEISILAAVVFGKH